MTARPFRLEEVPLVLSALECARLLGQSDKLVRELADAGTLPGRKSGKDWRFSRDAVLAWLAGDKAGRVLKGKPK